MTDVRQTLVIDHGPCRDAALILCESTTLTEHVNIADDNGYIVTIEQHGDIPYDLWGSGTQALWQLLCSITYSSDVVSLWKVASRLDQRNSASVAAALVALFVGSGR